MSIKHVTAIDLALCELARSGVTAAPPDVLEKLRLRGNVVLRQGRPELTAKGRKRGQRLLAFEHDMRLLFAADGRPLTTDGGANLHVGGGPASIS
jgi:hypothetical protein